MSDIKVYPSKEYNDLHFLHVPRYLYDEPPILLGGIEDVETVRDALTEYLQNYTDNQRDEHE